MAATGFIEINSNPPLQFFKTRAGLNPGPPKKISRSGQGLKPRAAVPAKGYFW
jgi:hypothetical protein